MNIKCVFVCFLLMSIMGVRTNQVPTLLIGTTNDGIVEIPIASIRKITYDKSDPITMNVITQSGTQSFLVVNVTTMTLSNVPQPTALEQIHSSQCTSSDAVKIVKDGVVYVVKEGRVYTLEGRLK